MAEPEEIIFDRSPLTRPVPAHRVYLKERWDEEWFEEKYLWCDWVVWCAAPEIPKAQLSWHYGRIAQPGRDYFADFPRLDKLRHYVRIEIDNPDKPDDENAEKLIWIGILEEDTGDHRTLLTGDDPIPSGRQTLTAYGLEILAERYALTESVVYDYSKIETRVKRAIDFNARNQRHENRGNRDPDPGSEGVYLFAHDLSTAEFWSTLQAAEYLLKYHAPADRFGDRAIQWQLSAEALLGGLPDWDRPRKLGHKKTLKQMLDELIDRRRLLSYYTRVVEIEGDDDRVEVVPFTLTPEDIDFQEHTIPANIAPKKLVFDDCPLVAQAVIGRSTANSVDEVVVTGERIVSCFSLSSGSSGLIKHWSNDLATEYNQGASLAADYAGLSIDDKQRRNEEARKADKFERVFSYFGLFTEWNGMLSDVTGGPVDEPWYPDPADETQPLPWYWPELRFLNWLPLKDTHDYSNGGDVDNTPEGQAWEYRRPLAVMWLDETTGTNSTTRRYQRLDRMGQFGIENTDGNKDRTWSAQVRVQEDTAGVVLRISGAEQHVIAGDDFTPLAADKDEGRFDWEDNLIVTVAAKVDAYAEARWPDPEEHVFEQIDSLRRVYIDVGDELQVHYLAPYTVLDVNPADGSLVVNDEGRFIRDDRPRFQALARLAYEWYNLERKQLTLSLEFLTAELRVGDLITTIGNAYNQQTINSVITSIRMEFPETAGEMPSPARMTLTTHWAELDARDLLNYVT